ncbi:hypothetical protein K490DRAFT_55729 [Saccharata proteae CBS 121410]|uniref:Secreted protein n=1 Tax=Saccharata proteae CBS 121410 TaxID=1314787 RepID=A0A6A5YB92_9PEZI|nr:hypothetical protein K490DRAFT_55729 [Saccharata proteae CBS 121410]
MLALLLFLLLLPRHEDSTLFSALTAPSGGFEGVSGRTREAQSGRRSRTRDEDGTKVHLRWPSVSSFVARAAVNTISRRVACGARAGPWHRANEMRCRDDQSAAPASSLQRALVESDQGDRRRQTETGHNAIAPPGTIEVWLPGCLTPVRGICEGAEAGGALPRRQTSARALRGGYWCCELRAGGLCEQACGTMIMLRDANKATGKLCTALSPRSHRVQFAPDKLAAR